MEIADISHLNCFHERCSFLAASSSLSHLVREHFMGFLVSESFLFSAHFLFLKKVKSKDDDRVG